MARYMVKNFSNVLALLELPWYVAVSALFRAYLQRYGIGAPLYVHPSRPVFLG